MFLTRIITLLFFHLLIAIGPISYCSGRFGILCFYVMLFMNFPPLIIRLLPEAIMSYEYKRGLFRIIPFSYLFQVLLLELTCLVVRGTSASYCALQAVTGSLPEDYELAALMQNALFWTIVFSIVHSVSNGGIVRYKDRPEQ